MEDDEVRKNSPRKRRSTDSAGNPTETEIVLKKKPRRVSEPILEDSASKSFKLDHEAIRQDEIVKFIRSTDFAFDDIRKLGECTMRLLCEIQKIADARGEQLNVQIPALSIPSPEVIAAMKQAIDGLIEDVEDVKKKVLGRMKVMTPAHSVMAAGKELHDEKWNVAVHEGSRTLQELETKEFGQDKAENLEQRKGLTQEREDAIPSDIVMNKLSCFKTRGDDDKLRLRRKKTRIMCQNCLDKPRNSVILRCKHSHYCHECLNGPEEKINNCPGCGKAIADVVFAI